MTLTDHMEIAARQAGGYDFPPFFYVDGEWDMETGMKTLREAGYLYNDDHLFPVYGEELRADYPKLYQFCEDFHRARRQSLIDFLAEEGYLEIKIDEKLRVREVWTPRGLDYLARQKAMLGAEDCD